jgi:hypothetical protein
MLLSTHARRIAEDARAGSAKQKELVAGRRCAEDGQVDVMDPAYGLVGPPPDRNHAVGAHDPLSRGAADLPANLLLTQGSPGSFLGSSNQPKFPIPLVSLR